MRSPSGHRLAVSVCATALLVSSSCSNPDTPATTTGSQPAADATATSSSVSPTASSTTPTSAPSTATPSTAAPTRKASTTEVIAVTLRNGKVKPAAERIEITRGARVSLRVTSDVADEVHVHGYDRFADLKPNRTTTLSFKASQKGLFEVEAENTATVLVRLLVR